MTVHLTLTGMYAGLPICGASKHAAAQRGDEFSHLPYTEAGWARLRQRGICPDCLLMCNRMEIDLDEKDGGA